MEKMYKRRAFPNPARASANRDAAEPGSLQVAFLKVEQRPG